MMGSNLFSKPANHMANSNADAPMPRGALANVAVRIAQQIVNILNDIREYQARQVRLTEDRPKLFRSNAGVMSTVTLAAAADPVKILEGNMDRKGVVIQDIGTGAAFLGIGVRPTGTTGYFLSANTGTNADEWDGKISGVMFTGEVWALSPTGTILNIIELS